MRGQWASLAVVVALLGAAGAWLLWPKAETTETTTAGLPVLNEDFAPIPVRASSKQAGLSLAGTVTDDAGTPIRGAEVHLVAAEQSRLGTLKCPGCGRYLLACDELMAAEILRGLLEAGEGTLDPAVTVRTDASGAFLFEGLKGGTFSVWATASGRGSAIVQSAEPSLPVALVLRDERRLSGRLLDPMGVGRSGARVWAVSHALSTVVETVSGPAGEFHFGQLGQGPFYLLASGEGLFSPAVSSATPEGAPPVIWRRPSQLLNVRVLRDGRPTAATVQFDAFHLKEAFEVGPSGQLQLEMRGRQSIQLQARADSLTSSKMEIELSGPETSTTLHLHEGATVWVTAFDEETGEPIPETQLKLDGKSVTARAGEGVSFGPLVPGDYSLTATARGYASSRRPIRIGAGENLVELDLRPVQVVSGRILDARGRGVEGANLALLSHSRLSLPEGIFGDDMAVSDATGAFSLNVEAEGTLIARHQDFGFSRRLVQPPEEGLDIVLDALGSMRVRVELEDGRPVEGAEVSVRGGGGIPALKGGSSMGSPMLSRSKGVTGPDGTLVIRGLRAGDYRVVAQLQSGFGSEEVALELEDGEHLHEVGVRLGKLASVAGRVVDRAGRPVPHVTVEGIGEGWTPVDGAGNFEIGGLTPGIEGALVVSDRNYEVAEPVPVVAGATQFMELVVQPLRRYRGRVVSTTHERFREFTVGYATHSDPEGAFEVTLRPWNRSDAPGSFTMRFAAPWHQEIELTFPEDQEDLGVIRLEPSPWVEGTVTDATGAPVRGAVIGWHRGDLKATSGSDGRFRLELPPGTQNGKIAANKGLLNAVLEASAFDRDVTLVLIPSPQPRQWRRFTPSGETIELFAADPSEH